MEGAAWESWFEPAPNGSWSCEWLDCGSFVGEKGTLMLLVSITGNKFIAYLIGIHSTQEFWVEGWVDEPGFLNNRYTNPNGVYYGGGLDLNLDLSGFTYPAIWEPAKLLNVPSTKGYFAEKPGKSADSKGYRYASHLDGTNVHILLE